MAFITVESCLNEEPHAKHSWREGFLWLTKKECGGAPERKPIHKHKLMLHMYPEYPFINPDKVVGHCGGCGTWCSVDKEGFYMVLRGEAVYHIIKEEDRDNLNN